MLHYQQRTIPKRQQGPQHTPPRPMHYAGPSLPTRKEKGAAKRRAGLPNCGSYEQPQGEGSKMDDEGKAYISYSFLSYTCQMQSMRWK